MLRWSEPWIERSERRLFEKWGAGIHADQVDMLRKARRMVFHHPVYALRKLAGPRLAELLIERAFYPLESAASTLGVRLLWRDRTKPAAAGQPGAARARSSTRHSSSSSPRSRR
jgi:hypothetical protein